MVCHVISYIANSIPGTQYFHSIPFHLSRLRWPGHLLIGLVALDLLMRSCRRDYYPIAYSSLKCQLTHLFIYMYIHTTLVQE